ncbi:hypothetical protein ACFV7R_28420 [Streptomyces sp. NPDC059866]|uniref:hypothetical protein n=1 Tax=Streptomyces sp. NPDC059866 TaxID=3346978 RepID=UPI0036664515
MRMVPLQARRIRLEHATEKDRAWLRGTLDRISHGVYIGVQPDGTPNRTPRRRPRAGDRPVIRRLRLTCWAWER